MKKIKELKIIMLATGIAFILGIVLIFSSLSIGNYRAELAIQASGGMMDTSEYERIITENTKNFRMVGGIISLVGGFGLITSGYLFYNQIDNYN